MPLNPSLGDIALRIPLACLAGALIGFNREARNEAAGLRTTVLVCLAACLAMVLASRKQRCAVMLCAERERFSEAELRRAVDEAGLRVVSWAITYMDSGSRYEALADVEWKGPVEDRTRTPPALDTLASAPGVVKLEW